VSVDWFDNRRKCAPSKLKSFWSNKPPSRLPLKNMPLSDLEKRMMYFTETGECPEDPIALTGAFEAEYDTTTYEKKISRLMARAYRRIKRDNPESYAYGTMLSVCSAKATITSSCSGDKTR
jgi:hypothetical protein